MAELWYKLSQLPDLTLNKYASLEGNGVDGVLEKHIAFLRQLNRKGIVSNLSFHLFYYYFKPDDPNRDNPGHRLNIYLMIKGREESLENVSALIEASALSEFYVFEKKIKKSTTDSDKCDIQNVLAQKGFGVPTFNTCAVLTKTETFLPSGDDGVDYYIIRDWEMNDDGRLYNLCKMMEAVNQTAVYRVDIYPVEKSGVLRDALRKPMSILRRKQDDRSGGQRDYDGRDVLECYEDLLERYDSSPHFIVNTLVFANGKEEAVSILDSAGSESLIKGKYNISTFDSTFDHMSFLNDDFQELENNRDRMLLRRGRPGLLVCREETAGININYLPVLFSLEELTPFFRLPALYDGEVIQLEKETAPISVDKDGALFLGKDDNGYDVYFPLKLLPKHAFVSGVPGSGKTNTMHHITSSLWKDHHIPFLVLEPAKQEYRALVNDPDMSDLYVFSPNADMSFPLHINPFEMPKGTMIAEHIRRLCSVFEGAFPLEPPMPFLLDTAIEAVYRELGWIPEHIYKGDEKTEDGNDRRLPSMSMLYRKLEEELKSTNYSDEVRGNLESALKVRIGSLLRREMGDVFDVPKSTFTPEKWLEVPAVIELESMGSGPANFLTLMLLALIRETLKVNPGYDGPCRHVIFIEEAHNLIGPESEQQSGADADPKTAATAFVVKMLAEVRALKEGIVIADQLPTVMAQEVLKNTGLKIGLRITSQDDRNLLGSTMAASPLQLEQMSTFDVGKALIFYEKLKRPFIMRIKEWFGEIEDKEMKEALVTSKNDGDLRNAMALCQSKTYIDENNVSIDIIGKKYYQKYLELQKKLVPINNWLSSMAKMRNSIKTLRDQLMQVEKGEIQMSNEQKMAKYDQLEYLETNMDKHLKDKTNFEASIKLVKEACDMILTLERLKNGRWKRFGASKRQMTNITIMQSAICSTVFEPYNMFIEAIGNGEKTKDMDADMKIIRDLNDEFEKTLNEDVAEKGEQYFYNK